MYKSLVCQAKWYKCKMGAETGLPFTFPLNNKTNY